MNLPRIPVILLAIVTIPLATLVAPLATARTVILDGSRGFHPGRDFDAYALMTTFMTDRGFTVVRSVTPLTQLDLTATDLIVVSADWMADGPHEAADREAILGFVEGGGRVIALADEPGPAVEALDQVTGALGITCGRTASSEGRVQVGNHPAVRDIGGLTFPAGSGLEGVEDTETLATDRQGTEVAAVREDGAAVVLVLGAPIWRDDLWTEEREQVLRQTLGWLSGDTTPVRALGWGRLKIAAGH